MNFSGSKKWIYILGVVVVMVIIFTIFSGGEENTIETVAVERGTLTQEISVTGRVKPQTDVGLAFQQVGKISRTSVSVGDSVVSGQILVTQENNELVADLAQAEAKLLAEKAKLSELQRGTREEELDIKQAELEKAQKDLDNYYNDVPNILTDAFRIADDALNVQIDLLFSNDNTNSPQISFVSSNQAAELDAESMRVSARETLFELDSITSTILGDDTSRDFALISSRGKLVLIASFLTRLSDALNASTSLSDTVLASYKADLNTARGNINAEVTDIDNQIQTIAAQKITVQKTSNELNLLLAGSTEEALAVQEASVAQAVASVQKVNAQIGRTILRSPVRGVVTTQDAVVGEIVSTNTIIVSVISESEFEIEANIVEADISNVKVEDEARLTLDAYGEDLVFNAHVVKKDPAETIIEGVTTYKTTFQFDEAYEKVSSGMTANIDIVTDKRDDALMVPQKAVIFRGGQKIVLILVGGEVIEKSVETGISGVYGNIEILSGIEEGDMAVTSYKKE